MHHTIILLSLEHAVHKVEMTLGKKEKKYFLNYYFVVQSILGHEVQGVEKHRNTCTQGECIADENIKRYCSKNITPTGSHMASKRSLANVNTSMASDTKTKDTNSQCFRVKINKKPCTKVIQYQDVKNGQRCESEDNSHVINDGWAQRCESVHNGQSHTSKPDNRTQSQDNDTHVKKCQLVSKNRFWPLCTEESVKLSSHGHEYLVDSCVSDSKSHKKVSSRVSSKNKCQAPSVNDCTASQNRVTHQETVVSPEATVAMSVNQSNILDDHSSDPDKYAMDLRFRPRHRNKIKEAKNCQIFKLWDKQVSDKFGYIPLQDQILPSTDQRNTGVENVLKMHDIISKSNTYNFLQCQITWATTGIPS